MFSSSLRASLVVLLASALVVSAAPAVSDVPSVTVKTSTTNVNVDGLQNLKVTTTIVNTGGETLKLLKDPRGALNSFPENTFTITGPTGFQPSFNGARVKYSPKYAAGLDDDSVFVVLSPGGSVDVVHDLSAAYDFTKSGGGEYSIQSSNLLTYVGADGTPKNLYATVEDTAKVKLSGNLAASRAHVKRAQYYSCSSDQQSLIEVAAYNAQSYSTGAYAYIASISGPTDRYTTWFGEYTDARKNIVQNHFGLIDGRDFTAFTYDCSCTDAGTYAYVYPDQFGTIYLCGAFWNAPYAGEDSQAGTLIHESSHFTDNGGTEDLAYGHEDCKNLATNDPDQAILNADSHEYFAENVERFV